MWKQSGVVLIVVGVCVLAMLEPVTMAPMVLLEEQALPKSQYEFLPERVIPLYYRERKGYVYDRPQIPFESGNINSVEVQGNSGGYVYNRPEVPFPYPTRATTDSLFPPASARTIVHDD